MDRKIIFDTETTGLNPKDGHKIVEFGAVEMIDGKLTGVELQMYFNPEREIPQEAINIHGITNEMVKDCPTFKEQADKLLSFIKGAELVAHNADFDVKMLDAEIEKANRGKLWDYSQKITDTLFLSRAIYPESSKHSLDALCARLNIIVPKLVTNGEKLEVTEGQVPVEGKRFDRGLHGALLDAKLLADVYLKMGVQNTQEQIIQRIEQNDWNMPEIKRIENSNGLKIIDLSIDTQIDDLKFQLLFANKSKDEERIKELKNQIEQLENTLPPIINKTSSVSFKFK